jgi:hypothetical protein
VQVEMRYQDVSNNFETQRTISLKPGDASQHWRVRLSDRSQNSYQYRLLFFLADGLRYQTEWQTSEDLALVINDPFQGFIKVRLVPVLDMNNLIEANVLITYEDQATGYRRTVQKIFTGGAPLTSQDVVIPTLVKDPLGFTHDTTIVRSDGSVYASGPREVMGMNTTLPVIDGEGQTSRIRVSLPPNSDLATTNLSALKVQVVGLGEHPDSAEALFTPSQTGEQVLTLVQPNGNGPFSYRYSVTGFNRLGVPVPGASGQEMSLSLLIPLPTA